MSVIWEVIWDIQQDIPEDIIEDITMSPTNPESLEYRRTHPWLTFRLDMTEGWFRAWVMLGEARSKCEHISNVPLKPSLARSLHEVYLAKGAQATTAIEGNTLTEEQVLKRMHGELHLPPSKAYLGQEVDNVLNAFNLMLDRIEDPDFDILTVETIKEYNRQVLAELELEDRITPGEIPTQSVHVGGVYGGAPRAECEYLLQRLCEWLNGPEFRPPDRDSIIFGLLRAILAHLYIAWIHPFGDGNGRTARLLECQILLAAGVPTPSAHLLSNHYNQTRADYYRQLRYASESGGDVRRFVEYALVGFVDGLRDHLEEIRKQQWFIAWRDYVFEAFDDRSSPADKRRRDLLFALTQAARFVPLSDVRHLTPETAEAYAGKTMKTVSRDLNELLQMDLVERTPQGYRAKTETVLAFLPLRHMRDKMK